MADDAKQKALDEKERKKAEVRARLEAASAGKKAKKGFMTPARKKKLRTLLRKKAAEELKKEQERKAEERKKTISERCGPQKNLDGINEAALMAVCKEYHQRIAQLEDAKYDLEYAVRQKDYVISELNMQVNDLRGKFIKPPLKKISKFEMGKFEKLMRAAKKSSNEFRANLKSVGPSTKFKLDDDVKETTKPEWAAGVKEAKKAEE